MYIFAQISGIVRLLQLTFIAFLYLRAVKWNVLFPILQGGCGAEGLRGCGNPLGIPFQFHLKMHFESHTNTSDREPLGNQRNQRSAAKRNYTVPAAMG